MSSSGDLGGPGGGESHGANSPGSTTNQPSWGDPRPQHQHRGARSDPKRKGPFHATVEDCPEDDGALASRTFRQPAPTSTSIPTASQAMSEREGDAEECKDDHMAGSHDSPFPPFIQLRGPVPQERHQPEALRYLDADSPAVTPEAIQRSVVENSNATDTGAVMDTPVSPVLSHSSVPSSHVSDVFSQGTRNSESHRSWSPEHIVPQPGSSINQFATQPSYQVPPNQGFHDPYGVPPPTTTFSHGGPTWQASPGRTHSNLNTAPFPEHEVPVMQTPYFSQPPLHAQKPLPTGYQHLALKLTGTLFEYPTVTPIYRRFEALHHRLLLQLQDEITELEQQLDGIDAADTNSRATPMGFLPASRRAENMAQGELGWQKQDVLGKIGWRLGQYNKIISSFKETQFLPSPTLREIEDYRSFLVQGRSIAEPEIRFLDDPNDLVSLATTLLDDSAQAQNERAGECTPTPQSSSVFGSPGNRPKSTVEASKAPPRQPPSRPRSPMYLVYAAIIAVLVPMLTFVVIPGFLERMVIVALVFSGVSTAVVQSGLLAGLPDHGALDCVICTGLYGGLMAVVAMTFA